MRLICRLAVSLIFPLSVAPALAGANDQEHCEHMIFPGFKVAACTRILQSGSLAPEAKVAALHNRAVGYLLQKQLDRAISEFNEALRLDPTYKRSYNSRGNAWKDKGELDKAIADYNEAIRLDPDFSFPYNGRGNAFYNKGELDRAIADYGEVIRLDPSLAAPHNNRAIALREKGELDRALADANEALRRDPRHTAVYANRGAIWRLKGDLVRALADQDESVRLDPNSPLPFLARGDTLRYKGELDRALRDYDQALRVRPDYIPAFVGRGLVFEKRGDIGRARAEYEKALRSRSEFRGDIAKTSLDTARARLAAFDSGAPQPVIPPAPSKTVTAHSIPTPTIAAPAAVPAATPSGRRVALVIGNSGYRNVSALANPQRDAVAIAASLKATGFDTVTIAADATRDKLIDALRTFATEAEKADWAMVYFAGHGMEVTA